MGKKLTKLEEAKMNFEQLKDHLDKLETESWKITGNIKVNPDKYSDFYFALERTREAVSELELFFEVD